MATHVTTPGGLTPYIPLILSEVWSGGGEGLLKIINPVILPKDTVGDVEVMSTSVSITSGN